MVNVRSKFGCAWPPPPHPSTPPLLPLPLTHPTSLIPPSILILPPYLFVVFVGQPHDEIVDVRSFRRLDHFLLASSGLAVHDVLADAAEDDGDRVKSCRGC